MRTLRDRLHLRPSGTRVKGPTLRVKIVGLVALAALAPAALVGIASYVTAQKIQAEQLDGWLAQQAASAEREVALFLETRMVDANAFARSRSLWQSLEQLEEALSANNAKAQVLARNRIDGYLLDIQGHDPSYEGLAVFDRGGTMIASTDPTVTLKPTQADNSVEGLERGPRGRTWLRLTRDIRGRSRPTVGQLTTLSSADTLWLRLASLQADSPARLRIVDGKRRTVFDSRSFPELPTAALPSIAGPVLEVRVGSVRYDDEAGAPIVAAHRFEPAFHFGSLAEVPATAAQATSRRFRDFALRGSLVTVALIAILGCMLALHITGPLQTLRKGVERATAGDLSHRVAVSSTDEIGYLTVAVNQMFDALERSQDQLERMSSTDELTGLFNRRHLAKALDVELNRAGRSGRPLSVLMIDLDHFKAFNDDFGHPQGDAFLRHVAAFLKTWLRATDVLARYGGEEFAALLPDTDLETATEIAERIRTAFAESRAPAIGQEAPITLSIGVSSWAGGSTLDANLIESADQALYDAKRNGRNRVRVAA